MKSVLTTAVSLLLVGCARARGNTPAPNLRAQIDANNVAWAAAANRGDAAAVAAMYTENATMLPPGMERQIGRAAIQKTVAAIGGSGVKNFALASIDVQQVGPDTAHGKSRRFSLDAPGPKRGPSTSKAKYVVVWSMVGGKWLLDVDIWNTNK